VERELTFLSEQGEAEVVGWDGWDVDVWRELLAKPFAYFADADVDGMRPLRFGEFVVAGMRHSDHRESMTEPTDYIFGVVQARADFGFEVTEDPRTNRDNHLWLNDGNHLR